MTKTAQSAKDSMDDFLEEANGKPAEQIQGRDSGDPTGPPEKDKIIVAPSNRPVKKPGRFAVRPTSINISPRMLPPITRRRKAVYQLIDGMNKVDPRIVDGNRNIEPPPFQLVPRYKIYDRFETDVARREKELVFSNDIRVHDYHNLLGGGKDERVDMRLQMPEFINGETWVDCEAEYLKYVWWELHPQNQSNKYRDKTKTPIFKRVDVEYASPHLQLIRRDLAIDAEMYVMKLNPEKLIALGAAFGISTSTPVSDMRLDLRMRASKNPQEVLFKGPDKKAPVMMNVMKSLDLGILEYRPDSQQFFFPGEDESFFEHLIEETPLESLTQYLLTPEGADDKKDLEDLLSFWS